jgi:LysR family glycine cleavage system transcriptional activator
VKRDAPPAASRLIASGSRPTIAAAARRLPKRGDTAEGASRAMVQEMPPLTWLRAFEASARHLSFAKAAVDLNLTPTAVSYQVRSLEQYLRHPLFERLPRGLRLSEMGAAYLPNVRRAFEDIAATTTKLFGQSHAARITIRAPVSFLSLWLAPRLCAFRAAHPDVDLLLLSTLWADAQPDQAIDIDIRFGTGPWPGFDAELLMQDPSVVVCAPELHRPGNEVEQIDAILTGSIIHVVGHENHWAEAFRRLHVAPARGVQFMRVDSSVVAVSMAAAARGAAIVLQPYAEQALATLPLRRAFDFTLPVEQAHYLLRPASGQALKLRQEVLLLEDWIRQMARSNPASG